MRKIIDEFRVFIKRGNVFDMAVGVVIGGAFGKITTSLVNDLLLPFIGWICGSRDMSAMNLLVRPAELNEAGEVVKEAISLNFGSFIGTVIDFLLIAFAVFLLVKAFNKAAEMAKKKEEAEKKEEAAEEEAKPSAEELLAQILDELKKTKNNT